jgi:hypothetical protein
VNRHAACTDCSTPLTSRRRTSPSPTAPRTSRRARPTHKAAWLEELASGDDNIPSL